MSKKIQIIFSVSFLLNIILIGIVLGGIYKPRHGDHFRNAPINQKTKDMLQRGMHQDHEEMREHFESMRSDKEALRSIIIAEDFDEAAYSTMMAKILAVKNVMSEKRAKTLGGILSGLSQTERKEISGHVLRKLSGKKHGKRDGRKHLNNGNDRMK